MASAYLDEALHTVFGLVLNDSFRGQGGAEPVFSFLNAISVGALVTGAGRGPDGPRIYFANTAIAKQCGYAVTELVGSTPKMFHGDRTNEAVATAFRNELENVGHATMRIVNYDSRRQPYIARVFGVKLTLPELTFDDLRLGLITRDDDMIHCAAGSVAGMSAAATGLRDGCEQSLWP